MRAVTFLTLWVISWTFNIWEKSNPDNPPQVSSEMNRVFSDSVSANHVYDSMMSRAQNYGGVKILWVSDSSYISNIQLGREY